MCMSRIERKQVHKNNLISNIQNVILDGKYFSEVKEKQIEKKLAQFEADTLNSSSIKVRRIEHYRLAYYITILWIWIDHCIKTDGYYLQ